MALLQRPRQEMGLPAKSVYEHFRKRKISAEVALDDILTTRDAACARFHDAIRFIDKRERERQQLRCMGLSLSMQHGFVDFVKSKAVDTWKAQYECLRRLRFGPLVLVGPSMIGKSVFAKSIFGIEKTLVVNCQGLAEALPSLRQFSPERFAAIVFDEANPAQVIANKLVFQAGCEPVMLGQSRCGAHEYSVLLSRVPMILVSNEFATVAGSPDGIGGTLSVDGAAWLQANCTVVPPPDSGFWYVRGELHSDGAPSA
jgi:hypothetical protein